MSKLLFLSIGVLLAILMSSCTYDKTVVTLGSAFDNTWSFSSGSGYDFDANYVEIKNGKAQLKELDLEHSGADFNNGTHVGTYVDGHGIQLQTKLDLVSTHINTIVPTKSSSLIGYWRMDNSWLDESITEAHGIPQNTTIFNQNAKVGEFSGKFDGVNQRVDIGNVGNLRPLKVSMSAWFRLTDNTPSIQFIGGYGHTGFRGYWLGFTGRALVFFAGDGVTGGASAQTNSAIIPDENVWYHVVGTYEAGIGKIYINGQLINTNTNVIGDINYAGLTDGFILGNTEALLSSRYFNGDLDEVSVWSDILTDEEIQSIYESQNKNYTELSSTWTPKWDNIVGYWKMDGNWQDSSGNSLHGIASGDATFSVDAKVGSQSGAFDGASDCVNISDTNMLDITDEITISTWVRSLDYTVDQVLLRKENAYLLYFFPPSTGEPKGLQGYFWGLSDPRIGYSNVNFENNRWYHVATTYDSSTIKLYVDGKEVASQPSTGTISTSANNLYIGTHENCSLYPLSGNIDDTSIWSKALTAADLALIYNRQKQKYAGSYDSEVIDLGSTISTWPDLSWSTSLPFGKELVGDFDNDGSPDSESSSVYPSLDANLSSGLVGYWGLNETSLNSILPGNFDFKDLSGNDNHANESGAITVGKKGKLLASPVFDRLNDYIEVNSFIPMLENLDRGTISLWFKSSDLFGYSLFSISDSSVSTNYMQIWVGNITGAFPDESLTFSLVRDGVSRVQAHVNNGEKIYQDNQWHHIVISVDDTENSIFIDGVKQTVSYLVGNPATLEFSRISDADSLILGARRLSGGVSGLLDGSIDEVGIWNRGLDNNEIQQLYRRGANRIKFQVKSCVDSSCICKSYNPAPLGNETDCDGDGILNALDNDDIHKSEFIGPGGDGTTYYSELFNRPTTEITFDCALNTTDSNPGVCVGDEITLAGGPKPTGPEFLQTDYTQFVSPSANQYAQYRVYMEADDNTACDGEPCLPELTSVNLNPSGITKYSGGLREVRPKAPITFNQLRNINITADACVTFRLARSGTDYYHDGSVWAPATIAAHRSTESELENNILQFGSQFGPGELEVIAYLETDSDQLTPCGVDEIDVNYK